MKVDIYGTPTCSYCKQAVSLCETRNIDYSYTDVSDKENLKILEDRVGAKVKFVPQIFLNDQYVNNGFNGLVQELAKN